MFHVLGYLTDPTSGDPLAYNVTVDPDAPDRPDALDDAPARIAGSPTVLTLLRASLGEQGRLHPTAVYRVLDLDDPLSVLAWLREHTDVVEVRGTVPEDPDPVDGEFDPSPPAPDTVY